MAEHHRSLDGPIVGIDYGSKLAGTTVLADVRKGSVRFHSCRKKEDADQLINDWCDRHRPARIFLDAPLSLPGVYAGLDGKEDYFYRSADRALQAMSPMFLGGLTARAMQLKSQLRAFGIELVEVYPGALARRLTLKEMGYKKKGDAREVLGHLLERHQWRLDGEPDRVSWHVVDALLAALIGRRFLLGQAEPWGEPEEGRIWV